MNQSINQSKTSISGTWYLVGGYKVPYLSSVSCVENTLEKSRGAKINLIVFTLPRVGIKKLITNISLNIGMESSTHCCCAVALTATNIISGPARLTIVLAQA